MNNGLIIDGVLVLLLLLSFFVGAKRGLFKSLMGFVVLIAAIVGAAIAANTLTEPITDLVLPAFEEKISDWLGVPEELTMGNIASGILSSDSTKNPSFSEWFEKLELFRGGDRFVEHLQEKAANAAHLAARSLVESVVHAVLLLASFVMLLIVLKLLTGLIDHVFELPVLHALNTLGGGVFALLEAAILLYLVLWLAPEFGITFFRDNASDTYLLKFFTTHTPFTLIAIIASLNGGN